MRNYIIHVAIFILFSFTVCTTKSPYESESMSFPTEIESNHGFSSAIPMAWLHISNATGFDIDFSHKHISVEHIGDDAYKVTGRCFYDNSEHLYEIRVHFKGGERQSMKDWDYSTISISDLGHTETQYQGTGTWDADYTK